jgi:hypothetical protein
MTNICINGHYFDSNELLCPHCSYPINKKIDLLEKSCIECGQLCPPFAYGCKIGTQLYSFTERKSDEFNYVKSC